MKKTCTMYNIAVVATRLPIPSPKAASRFSCSKASSKETDRAKELLSEEENELGEENLHDLQHSGRGEQVARKHLTRANETTALPPELQMKSAREASCHPKSLLQTVR